MYGCTLKLQHSLSYDPLSLTIPIITLSGCPPLSSSRISSAQCARLDYQLTNPHAVVSIYTVYQCGISLLYDVVLTDWTSLCTIFPLFVPQWQNLNEVIYITHFTSIYSSYSTCCYTCQMKCIIPPHGFFSPHPVVLGSWTLLWREAQPASDIGHKVALLWTSYPTAKGWAQLPYQRSWFGSPVSAVSYSW